MIREELARLTKWEERHRRLVARIVLTLGLTLVMDILASVIVWDVESGVKGGDIHGFGDSLFFVTVQLLTVSSQIRNPLTAVGKAVDVVLEIWAVFVVTAVAGSFGAFFSSSDS